MFTRNFRANILYLLFKTHNHENLGVKTIGGESFQSSNTTVAPQNIKSLMSTIVSKAIPGNLSTSTATDGYVGVAFGTGATQATFDDYMLSGDQVIGFSSSNVTHAIETAYTDDYMEHTAVYTLTNTTGADVTIGEIGIVDFIAGTLVDASSAKKHPVLIAREALDAPLTIPAGGIGQVTYTIRMNYPTA